ncbi:hypothetical protein [Acuticoccus sp. I52.16.1]|uniref:hypothetical protein n=1 Tax=Acuticoccus sp. I52.16.1 TaxID=2928472 RepID=UPI001FD13D28|nr:hypothetical protein [Acuticoccus sp. I52.16.1]UOM36642.1 hypothetical protein MRB58_10825 [Acuticoccus sp. I52.16.1]
MKGLSERQYAARIGLSRGAVQKAKSAGRLVLHDDGSIDPDRSDALRADTTDVSKSRPAERSTMKRPAGMRAVPEAALSGVSETLKENGLAAPPSTGGTTFLQAKTAHEVLKAQERRIRLSKLKGDLVDRDRAKAMVFKLAREERDAWVTWPARVAALMAAELGTDVGATQRVLESHVRAHLEELAELRVAFR